jgi:hypothetical protein|eukprot:COSAG01_NODE_5202_length_4414_cov_32.900116_6_plen_108_part_00
MRRRRHACSMRHIPVAGTCLLLRLSVVVSLLLLGGSCRGGAPQRAPLCQELHLRRYACAAVRRRSVCHLVRGGSRRGGAPHCAPCAQWPSLRRTAARASPAVLLRWS